MLLVHLYVLRYEWLTNKTNKSQEGSVDTEPNIIFQFKIWNMNHDSDPCEYLDFDLGMSYYHDQF